MRGLAGIAAVGLLAQLATAAAAGPVEEALAIDEAVRAGQVSRALSAGAAARAAYPDSAAVASSYGFALLAAHRLGEALAAAEAAVALAPDDAGAQLLLGLALTWGAEWDRTEAALHKALALGVHPDDEATVRFELERIERWRRIATSPESDSAQGAVVTGFVDAVRGGRIVEALESYVDLDGIAQEARAAGVSLANSRLSLTAEDEAEIVEALDKYAAPRKLRLIGLEVGPVTPDPSDASGLQTATLRLVTLSAGLPTAHDVEAMRSAYEVVLSRRARGEPDLPAVSIFGSDIDAYWIGVLDGLSLEDRDATLTELLGTTEQYEEVFEVSLVKRDGRWLIADITGETLKSVFGTTLRSQILNRLRMARHLRDATEDDDRKGSSHMRTVGLIVVMLLIGLGASALVRRLSD